jgi:hypothetical protein
MMMAFATYGRDNCSDARVWDEKIRLARVAAAFHFGDTPHEIAERGLKLVAKEVLPVPKAQAPAGVRAAAE